MFYSDFALELWILATFTDLRVFYCFAAVAYELAPFRISSPICMLASWFAAGPSITRAAVRGLWPLWYCSLKPNIEPLVFGWRFLNFNYAVLLYTVFIWLRFLWAPIPLVVFGWRSMYRVCSRWSRVAIDIELLEMLSDHFWFSLSAVFIWFRPKFLDLAILTLTGGVCIDRPCSIRSCAAPFSYRSLSSPGYAGW